MVDEHHDRARIVTGDVADIIETVAIGPRHVDDHEIRRLARDGVEQKLAREQPCDRG